MKVGILYLSQYVGFRPLSKSKYSSWSRKIGSRVEGANSYEAIKLGALKRGLG